MNNSRSVSYIVNHQKNFYFFFDYSGQINYYTSSFRFINLNIILCINCLQKISIYIKSNRSYGRQKILSVIILISINNLYLAKIKLSAYLVYADSGIRMVVVDFGYYG